MEFFKLRRKNQGISFVELLLVVALIAVFGALVTPRVRDLLIQVKVDPVAVDISKVVNAMRLGVAGSSAQQPYAPLGSTSEATATFANKARSRVNSLTVIGDQDTATIQHPLGEMGAEITVSVSVLSVLGDAFNLSMDTVYDAACPDLATALSRQAEVISINGSLVKEADGAYSTSVGQAACASGAANTFVFTFR